MINSYFKFNYFYVGRIKCHKVWPFCGLKSHIRKILEVNSTNDITFMDGLVYTMSSFTLYLTKQSMIHS